MPKDVKTEVNELLDEYLPGDGGEPPEDPPKEDPPKEEPPVEEPPVEEPPKEEPPVEEPPVEEPPKEEPPVEEPPAEETPEEKLERLEKQNALLLERIEKGFESPPAAEPKKEEPPKELPPKEEPPKDVKPSEPIDFLGDRTLEEVLDTKDGLNKFLNEVISKITPGTGGSVDTEPVVERILSALPKIVQTQVTQQTAINELVADFYKNNEDLKVARRTVGIFANEVHSENPDWETKKVFEEAGVRTRKALGLREKAAAGERTRGPAFTKSRGARKGGEKDTRTELAKDIDDLVG